MCDPSRFISEIPEQYIDVTRKVSVRNDSFQTKDNFSNTLAGLKADFKPQVNLKNFHKLSSLNKGNILPFGEDVDIQAGMEVEHDRFGKGKVLNVEGNGPNKKATIFFSGIGQKQLLLRFAKLKVIK